MTSARFFANGVDHCRAAEEFDHREPVDRFTPKRALSNGQEYPENLAPALMLISSRAQWFEEIARAHGHGERGRKRLPALDLMVKVVDGRGTMTVGS